MSRLASSLLVRPNLAARPGATASPSSPYPTAARCLPPGHGARCADVGVACGLCALAAGRAGLVVALLYLLLRRRHASRARASGKRIFGVKVVLPAHAHRRALPRQHAAQRAARRWSSSCG